MAELDKHGPIQPTDESKGKVEHWNVAVEQAGVSPAHPAETVVFDRSKLHPTTRRVVGIIEDQRVNSADKPVPIVGAHIAKAAGISRSRAKQIITWLIDNEFPIPEYVDKATAIKQAAAKREALEKEKQARRKEREKQLKNRRENVAAARRDGLGNTEIARTHGLKRNNVSDDLALAMDSDPNLRLRKKRRTKEEIDLRDSLVLRLYIYDVSNQEIGELLGLSKFEIMGSFLSLRRKDLLLNRPERKPREGRIRINPGALRSQRDACGVKANVLTEQLGLGIGYISNLENGGGLRNVSYDMASRIAAALGTTVEELTTATDEIK